MNIGKNVLMLRQVKSVNDIVKCVGISGWNVTMGIEITKYEYFRYM